MNLGVELNIDGVAPTFNELRRFDRRSHRSQGRNTRIGGGREMRLLQSAMLTMTSDLSWDLDFSGANAGEIHRRDMTPRRVLSTKAGTALRRDQTRRDGPSTE